MQLCCVLLKQYDSYKLVKIIFDTFTSTLYLNIYLNFISVNIHQMNVRCQSRWENLDHFQYRFQPIKFMNLVVTVLCNSNANDNRRILHFVFTIYCRYISETSQRSTNIKTINQPDICKIFAICLRDIVIARLHCNDISQSEMIFRHDISLQRSSL